MRSALVAVVALAACGPQTPLCHFELSGALNASGTCTVEAQSAAAAGADGNRAYATVWFSAGHSNGFLGGWSADTLVLAQGRYDSANASTPGANAAGAGITGDGANWNVCTEGPGEAVLELSKAVRNADVPERWDVRGSGSAKVFDCAAEFPANSSVEIQVSF
jgi:hypothetical protein